MPRIDAFVSFYPSAFKPYLDTQFLDLGRAGHDLRIVALGRLDREVSAGGRLMLQRGQVRYAYREGRFDALRRLPTLGLALATRTGWIRKVWAAERHRESRARLRHLVRAASFRPRDVDLVLVHGLGTLNSFSWLPAVTRAPVALYYHGGEPADAGSLDPERVRRVLRSVDVVFTNTGFSRAQAVERGARPDRIVVLPVGFDLASFRPSPHRAYRPGGGLRLISVGRLSVGKGIGLAVEAVRRLRADGADVTYEIVGDGPTRQELEARVRRAGLTGRVQLSGTLPHREALARLEQADALVLPSFAEGTWAETQAAVVQEAALMRAAVVAADTGGVKESTPPVWHPFSFPEADVDALVGRLRDLLEVSGSQLAKKADEASEWVRERYDVATLNRRLVDEALRLGKVGV